jgi:FtsP/CotA-like multicopper oxidase with cupredoxin domain
MIGRITLLFSIIWSTSLRTFSVPDHAGNPRPAIAPNDTLKSPPLLVNQSSVARTVEVSLTAAPARLALQPGKVTDAWAFNGMVPGPTLEFHEGDKVIVHFTNKLPEATTIHWHGLHIPADMDGSPLYPVPPGGKKDYVFTIDSGTAGTYWYHPHPDVRTGYQVAKGLYGALIIRPPQDPLAGIPERLLILTDNRFRPDGAVDFAASHSIAAIIDQENGREGNVIFVNGQVMPSIPIRTGEVQRWRVINASAARVYRLALPGQTLIQVGSDGGLFEHPAEVKEILLANSERVEFLVRGTGTPGSVTTLQTLPYDRYMSQTRPADWDRPRKLLALAYTTQPPVPPVPLPRTLRAVPALDTSKATVHRTIVMSQGLLNGRTMDMARVDARVRLGATEIWTVENIVGMDHPFHLHGFRFQVLDRNGVPERARHWKDSVNVPKHGVVRFIVHFDANPGRWMFHCHILDHEDHGMMGLLEIN